MKRQNTDFHDVDTDFHDVDTAQHIARDGRSGLLELERAAQILDGEVDRLGTELDAVRARGAELAKEWARGLADGQGRHVPARRMWPELAALLDALVDGADR